MKILTIALAVVLTLTAAIAVRLYLQNNRVPELGVENGQLKPLGGKPNGVSTQALDPSKLVEPWPVKASSQETMSAIRQSIESYGGATFVTEAPDYLYVIFTTPTMGFRDDAEFLLDQEQGLVHFRSQSRSGTSDMGLNRERYQALRQAYQ